MIKLFKKTPDKKLKKLSLLPTQYSHENLTPIEVTRDEREKFNIRKKSSGYFEDNYFYDKIELVDNDTLYIETNVLTAKDCEDLINLFYKELGACNKEKGKWDSDDLYNLNRVTTAKVRNWNLEHEDTEYTVTVSNYSEGPNYILYISSDVFRFR